MSAQMLSASQHSSIRERMIFTSWSEVVFPDSEDVVGLHGIWASGLKIASKIEENPFCTREVALNHHKMGCGNICYMG